MTTVSPNRRERMRIATLAEIKAAARRLLVAGGPTAISLRAIARDMGLTASALYRYFPSLDALVADLCADLYADVHQVIGGARDELPAGDPAGRLAAMARTFRRWAVTHPAEFSLIFGAPIPGVASGEDRYTAADEASSQFGGAFLAEFGALWQRHQLRASAPVSPQLTEHLAPHISAHAGDLPAEVIHTFLSGWIRLYGLVAMEVYGHLSWVVTDPEPLFEAEIATFLHHLTAPASPASPASPPI